MMANPLLSVITVCYNAKETIENTILSVIKQSYNNVEYVIIDGASTDGTLDLIKKYESKINYWISEPDKGIYDAMNKATKVATGDYLFFLNSDDIFYNNDVLSEFAAVLNSNNTIYYGDVIFSKWRLSYTNICHQAIFYPKIVFKNYSYNTRYKIYADWNLNILCYADKNIQFQYVRKFVTYYSICGLSNLSPKDDNFTSDFYRIISKNFGLLFCLADLIQPFRVIPVVLVKKTFRIFRDLLSK